MSRKQKLLNLFSKIKSFNLFNSGSNDMSISFRERVMTRLYVVLLMISFIILAFYIGLSETRKEFTVRNPSQNDYEFLLDKYEDTLDCQCSRTAIRYSNFTTLNVTYHQICRSGFISPIFIGQLFAYDYSAMYGRDFMTRSALHFIHLAQACSFTIASFTDAFQNTLNREFVTLRLLAPDEFIRKIQSDFSNYRDTTIAYSNRGLAELVESTTISYVITATHNAFNLRITSNGSVQIEPEPFSNCSCMKSPITCSTDAGFYDYNPATGSAILLYKIMGVKLGCAPFRSSLLSTFDCWYSAECYSQVLSFWRNRTANFLYTPALLDRTLDIRFSPSQTLQEIVEYGFLDQINLQPTFSAFFSACAPTSCIYYVNGRQNILIIITQLISIISGLSVTLRLITPLLVQSAYLLMGHLQGNSNLWRSIRALPQRLHHLNFFFDHRKSSAQTQTTEQHTTRLYILLWCSVSLTLVIYNIYAETTITKSVSNPTETIFEQLNAVHGTSLQCPCTTITFSYRSFTQVNTRLHQVCTSPFVESDWIESMFDSGNWSELMANQLRSRGVVYFLVQQSFCAMGQRVVNSISREFLESRIFRGLIITEQLLLSQLSLAFENTKQWNIIDFVNLIRSTRAVTKINQLMNVFSSNWIYSPQESGLLPYFRILTKPVMRGSNCSCGASSACTEPVYVDEQVVPGFVLGCFPVETLLRSTLSCLYNQTCVEMINFGNLSIRALDSSIPSLFKTNDTVETLMSTALIEEMSLNMSYPTYFAVCNPVICTYSVSERKDLLQVITVMLGLYGGLTLILRALSPKLMSSLGNAYARIQHRHQ